MFFFNTGHIALNSSKVIFCVSKAEEVIEIAHSTQPVTSSV